MATRTRTRTATTTRDIIELIEYRFGQYGGQPPGLRITRSRCTFEATNMTAYLTCEIDDDAQPTAVRRELADEIDAFLGYHLPHTIATCTRVVPSWPFDDDEPPSQDLG